MAHFITGCLWLLCVLWTVTPRGKRTAPTRTGRELNWGSLALSSLQIFWLCFAQTPVPGHWGVSASGLWLPLLSLFIIAVIYYCLLLVFFFLVYFVSTFMAIFFLFLAISLLPREATLDFETLKLPNLCPPYQRSCLRLTANLGQVH